MTEAIHSTDGTDGLPTDAQFVGVDAAGRDHYHSRVRDAVLVDDGDALDTHDLNGRGLGAWVTFVEIECGGWTEVRYTEDGITALFVSGGGGA